MKPLVLPQISINGTSRQELVDQQVAVIRAMDALLAAMAAANPHGRDYQCRPAEYTEARDAWRERIRAVNNIFVEISAHAMAIQDGE